MAMAKFEGKKYARLFARDKRFVRMGTLITPALLVVLALGVILMFNAPEGEGAFTGFHLAAFLIIVFAVALSAGIWIYFSIVHGKVKALVLSAAGEYIARDEQLMPFISESGKYVFSVKGGKKFLLCEEGNKNRVMHFSYVAFESLYDEDVTFYNQTALAFGAYFYKKSEEGAQFFNITLSADYGNKKIGVNDYIIVSEGVFNKKLLSKFKKLSKKLYS